jgi:hypothetical protein
MRRLEQTGADDQQRRSDSILETVESVAEQTGFRCVGLSIITHICDGVVSEIAFDSIVDVSKRGSHNSFFGSAAKSHARAMATERWRP